MKKLLSLLLAILMIASLAACSNDGKDQNDLDEYEQEEIIIDNFTKDGQTFYFDALDSETVTITGYKGGDVPHTVKIPSTIPEELGGKKIVAISDDAFYSLSNVAEVELPNTIIAIGDRAFANCITLKSITIPASVETLGKAAFYKCFSLESITFEADSKLTEIPQNAFQLCTSLKTLTIPSYIETVGTGAFLDCSALTTLTIEEGVKELRNNAFQNCTDLTTLKLPASLTAVGEYNFTGCDVLYMDGITLPDNAESVAAKYITALNLLPTAPATEDPDATTEEPGTSTEPGTTEPGTTEPGTSEPSSTEPVAPSEPGASTEEPSSTSEPATSEPATSEPATSEPATSEPATSEPATSEPPASSEEPPASSEEPPASSEEPPASSEEPPVVEEPKSLVANAENLFMALPEKYTLESNTVVFVPSSVIDTGVTNAVVTTEGKKADGTTPIVTNYYLYTSPASTGASAHGVIKLIASEVPACKEDEIYHYYIDTNNTNKATSKPTGIDDITYATAYIRYSFEITEAGYYQIASHHRSRNGSNRNGWLQFDDGEKFSISMPKINADGKNTYENEYASLYFEWNETFYFEAGTHTLTYTLDENANSSIHWRDLWFLKVAD